MGELVWLNSQCDNKNVRKLCGRRECGVFWYPRTSKRPPSYLAERSLWSPFIFRRCERAMEKSLYKRGWSRLSVCPSAHRLSSLALIVRRLPEFETFKRMLGAQHPYADQHSRAGVDIQESGSMGREHPDTLTSMEELAWTFWNQEREKVAEELLVQLVGTKTEVLACRTSFHTAQHGQPGVDVQGRSAVEGGGRARGASDGGSEEGISTAVHLHTKPNRCLTTWATTPCKVLLRTFLCA